MAASEWTDNNGNIDVTAAKGLGNVYSGATCRLAQTFKPIYSPIAQTAPDPPTELKSAHQMIGEQAREIKELKSERDRLYSLIGRLAAQVDASFSGQR